MRTRYLLLAVLAVGVGVAALPFKEWYPAIKTGISLVSPAPNSVAGQASVPGIVPPEGWRISLFAVDLPGARVIVRDPAGKLLVSQTREGKVSVVLPDADSDGASDGVSTLVEGLNNPHGIVLREEEGKQWLYIAETGRISKYPYASDSATIGERVVVAPLPEGGRHSTRTLLSLADGRILVSVGSTCDVCIEEDPRAGAVFVVPQNGEESRAFATGLRNTVFMTLRPGTDEVWGTDMGRDWLGDDIPPDEVNIIKEGQRYGWPFCYGKSILDTDFTKAMRLASDPCKEAVPSHIDLQAHSAPLGLAFVPSEGWPNAWSNDLLIAYHGSWNRKVPTGYKIVRIPLDEEGVPVGSPADFITGWLDGEDVRGRPVDILLLPGGEGYISDDHRGVLYHLHRIEEAR